MGTRSMLIVGLSFLSALVAATTGTISASERESDLADTTFEKHIEEYFRLFPYQDTYEYLIKLTGGDPGKLNTWMMASRDLVRAGEDKIVRTNNDTLYKMAFLYLSDGPVVLRSDSPSKDRFSSFQLQDDRNANYRNVVHPAGSYTLYFGEQPETVEGEAIEALSLLSAVISRIEVKDKNDPSDMAAARRLFDGIIIEGPKISELPIVDVLSGFDDKVVQEAARRMQDIMLTVPYRDMIATSVQEPGKDIPYLYHATGTREGWGGPATSHSSYESMFVDSSGETLEGSKGIYKLTTQAPPVNAFWSVTVYDTQTGRLHPNPRDRYHINNTTAVPNGDGSYTFRFKLTCEDLDKNCLEVPPGPFDIAARYYLPEHEIMVGEWTMPCPTLEQSN